MFRPQYVDRSELYDATTKSLATGTAEFTVKKVKTHNDKGNPLVNKSGHEMFQLILSVKDSEGKTGTLLDYLHANYPSKIVEFLDSIGLGNLWRREGFNPQLLIGNGGRLSITMRPTEKNPEGVPSVDYYCEMTQKKAAPAQNKKEEEFDDQIPF